MRTEGFFYLLRINGISPSILHHHSVSAATLCVFLHATTEHPVLTDDDGVTRRDQIDKGRFHAGRAWGGEGNGEFVLGFKRVLQQLLGVIHQLDEQWIKVADGRPP